VSAGASAFASRSAAGPHPVPQDELVSEQARSRWLKWKQWLEEAAFTEEERDTSKDEGSIMQDTVGAVAYDHSYKISAGVSR